MELQDLESNILCSKEEDINYANISLNLITIIKELENKIEKLESRINTLAQYIPE